MRSASLSKGASCHGRSLDRLRSAVRRRISGMVRVLQSFADALATRAARQGNWGTTPSSSAFGSGAAPRPSINKQKAFGLGMWIFLRFRTLRVGARSSLDTRRRSSWSRGSLRLVRKTVRSYAALVCFFCGCRFRGGAFA